MATQEQARAALVTTVVDGPRPLRVLLVSPVPGRDVATGDVVYTEMLVGSPPAGVEYETYDQAEVRGAISFVGTRRALVAAGSARARVAQLLTAIGTAPVRMAKRRGLLFREPIHTIDVRAGEYDLIHVHCFNVRFTGAVPPVVMSHALPLENLYRDACGWSATRARRVERVERVVGRIYRTNMFSTGPLPQVNGAIALTPYVAEAWRRAGVQCWSRTIPIPQPRRAATPVVDPHRIGFIANDFRSKGGPLLLQAFAEALRRAPHLQLHVFGADRSAGPSALPRAVEWHGRIPRADLLARLQDGIDLVCHPTGFDGLPLAVLEAMSFGIPTLVSAYAAMPFMVPPELVVHDGRPEAWADAILRCTEAERHLVLQASAAQHFARHFDAAAVLPQLRGAYEAAVDEPRGRGRHARTSRLAESSAMP